MQKLSFHSFDQLKPVWDMDESHKIVDVLNTKHSVYLDGEGFEFESGFNKDQIQIKVCLKKNDKSVIYPIEIICVYDEYSHLKVQEISHIIMDYIDFYWSEYFMDERNLFVPLDWGRYECEGITFFLRGFVRNLSLEMQADAFLKECGPGEHEIAPISSET